MRLSVVMAVRNGEPYVGEAIASVLSQPVADFEFLIVDDASTDGTAEILAAFARQDDRIRLLWNERTLGPYPSANRALLQARGRYIARHDADDISTSDRFAVQLAALEAHEDTVLVTGAVEVFDQDGGRTPRIRRSSGWQPRLEWDLLFTNAVGAGAHVMFPRVIGSSPVLFPAKHFYAEDYGLWCHLARRGRVVCPAAVVYRYRQHSASIGSTRKPQQDECFALLRHEYQSLFLTTAAPLERSAELTRFWRGAGGAPRAQSRPYPTALLAELVANFLAYVEHRHGGAERATLERQLDDILVERLDYWLARSLGALERQRCGEILALARDRGMRARVVARVLRRGPASIARTLRRRRSG